MLKIFCKSLKPIFDTILMEFAAITVLLFLSIHLNFWGEIVIIFAL
ncbi:hypothetical protein AAJ76_240003761 [Vairimorpha ceranae]|uniref:Uncharacterized protein n=1 Tax=Vairimorpha ceranae TaxID=40302 RepID=A0A0F9YRT3_9MICR|nr:hypothetical protein AAJ76_240003761 [Vairimorpha ceranae]KKO75312.1 hypothetical protein AAJ76_240003761 [Vairimorpha ceranae]